MIQIINREKCCGCTACYSICPKKCIEMKPDEEGFLYPVVNTELCIDCCACDNVCPIQNEHVKNEVETKSYIARSISEEVLLSSSSGGMFAPIANYILSKNGVVCGAIFDDNFNVVHKCVDNSATYNELKNYRGSKYVQSNMVNNYQQIHDELINNRLVCFFGTPCQVVGLKSFLKKEYENLLTVDLVCHGTPSPKLWRKYLDYMKSRYNSSVSDVSFRNKTYGYHSGTMQITFANGKIYHGSARVDFMLKALFKNLSLRPCCYECAFKSVHHVSDLTIYDCQYSQNLVKQISDDDKGYTNIIVQSVKGEKLLGLIRDEILVYEVDTSKQIVFDGIMVNNSAKIHPQRDQFFFDSDTLSIDQLTDKYIPVRKKDKVVEFLKPFVYKFGLLNLLKKIFK